MTTLSLHDKVQALNDLFRIDEATTLKDIVVEEMRKTMGLERERNLPAMVDSLMKATHGTPAEPTGVAAVPVAVTPGATSTRLGAKRNTRRPTPPATTRVTAGKRKQQTLFAALPDAKKTCISAEELRKQRTQPGYKPREEDRRTFDSELVAGREEAGPRRPVVVYTCSKCARTFTTCVLPAVLPRPPSPCHLGCRLILILAADRHAHSPSFTQAMCACVT